MHTDYRLESQISGGAWQYLSRFACIAVVAVLASVGSAQQLRKKESDIGQLTHGTVNIVLANKNGLVAVTDSLLSNERGMPVGTNKKLFRIDDRTVCTVAGWFGAPGPVTTSMTTPLGTSIPAFFSSFIVNNSDRLSKMTVDEKLQSLTRVLISSLEIVDEIDTKSHSKVGMLGSQIILAQTDDGVLRIARVDLTPELKGPIVNYLIKRYPTRQVMKELVYYTAGIDEIAFDVLNGIGPHIEGDLTIAELRTAMLANKTSELTLDDLEKIGEDLVERTIKKYPNAVGYPIQMAVIENNKATVLKQAFADWKPYRAPVMMSNVGVKDYSGQGAIGGKGFFIFRGVIAGGTLRVTQNLDGAYFFESQFSRCKLLFAGDPESIFDSSNVVNDCELVVTSAETMSSPFVSRFKQDFPAVPVSIDSGATKR